MTMSKRLKLATSLVPLLGALALATPAQAAPPGGGWGGGHHDGGRGDFRGHDHFGFGFGFGGPWWGWGGWDSAYWGGYPYAPYYPYDYPPYPAYYAPPGGYAPPAGYAQPGGYAPPPGSAPQAPAQASVAPPPQYWYYCDSPQGYYPYVQNCGSTWKQVAATPPAGSGNTITPKRKP